LLPMLRTQAPALLRRALVLAVGRRAFLQNPANAVLRKDVNSLANPKLALFFVALFPQFLAPGAAVLPAALAMAAVIVAFDVLWYGSVALLVDRARRAVRPRLVAAVEKVTGAVLLGFGVRLAAESR